MQFFKILILSCLSFFANAQTTKNNKETYSFNLPTLESLFKSIDIYFTNNSNIQIDEVRLTTKYKWLSYLPSPGYSPFTGGFTVSMNLLGPLNEVRTNYTTKAKIKAIQQRAAADADDLKNSVLTDFYKIEMVIEEFEHSKSLDSLRAKVFDLALKKYNDSQITPSEFLSYCQQYEAQKLERLKEANKINEAINNLIYKAKMPVARNNRH